MTAEKRAIRKIANVAQFSYINECSRKSGIIKSTSRCDYPLARIRMEAQINEQVIKQNGLTGEQTS